MCCLFLYSHFKKLVTRLFFRKSFLLFLSCKEKLFRQSFNPEGESTFMHLNFCCCRNELNSIKAGKNTKDRARVQECLYELRHFILLDDGLVFTHSPSESLLTLARVFFSLPKRILAVNLWRWSTLESENENETRVHLAWETLSESEPTRLNNFLGNLSSQKSSARVYRHNIFCDVTVAKQLSGVLVKSPIFPLDL